MSKVAGNGDLCSHGKKRQKTNKKKKNPQEAWPAQLFREVLLETLPGNLDLKISQAWDLDRLCESCIGLEQGGHLEICFSLLCLLDVLRLGPEVNHGLHPVRLRELLAVREGRIVWFVSC